MRSSRASAKISSWRCRSASARPITSPTRCSRARPPIPRSSCASSPRSPWRSRAARATSNGASCSRSRTASSPAIPSSLTRWRCTRARCRRTSRSTSFFFAAGTRLGIAAAQQSYICANYTHALRYVLDRGVNVVAQLVAKRVRGGETRFSLSCNPDLTLDLLACRARKACDFLFVGQVNSELPFMPGDGDIAESEFDLMLDAPATDFRLFAPPREAIDPADYAAGLHVARTVADGGTLQLGIGSLGDAVAHALI